jgi:hypothetical protein
MIVHIYLPRRTERAGFRVLDVFDVLEEGVVASERYSNICMFKEVSNFSNQGGRKSKHGPFCVVRFCRRKREGWGNGSRDFFPYAVSQLG